MITVIRKRVPMILGERRSPSQDIDLQRKEVEEKAIERCARFDKIINGQTRDRDQGGVSPQ